MSQMGEKQSPPSLQRSAQEAGFWVFKLLPDGTPVARLTGLAATSTIIDPRTTWTSRSCFVFATRGFVIIVCHLPVLLFVMAPARQVLLPHFPILSAFDPYFELFLWLLNESSGKIKRVPGACQAVERMLFSSSLAMFLSLLLSRSKASFLFPISDPAKHVASDMSKTRSTAAMFGVNLIVPRAVRSNRQRRIISERLFNLLSFHSSKLIRSSSAHVFQSPAKVWRMRIESLI